MGHLVISGTGRAGTTFLVQWLAASGLDIGTFGDGDYFADARAGLERRLLPDVDLPHVVKDPWLWTYLHRVDLAATPVDVLVVPVRDLHDAAMSRVARERAALPGWDASVHGFTPGGVIYSLDAADQERLLAVGFHHLLAWAVANDLPTVLLSYPRLVRDADYATDRLRPWLPDTDRARHAHRLVAAP